MSLPQFAFPQQSLYTREIAPRQPQAAHRLRLPRSELKPQPKDLLGEFPLARCEFRGVEVAQLFDEAPRRHQRLPARVTNLVRMGSLCEASSIAWLAVARSTPAISNITRPGLTTATQCSGAPLDRNSTRLH